MHMTPEDVSPHAFVPGNGYEYVKTGVLCIITELQMKARYMIVQAFLYKNIFLPAAH
jgi:hypothetical protein